MRAYVRVRALDITSIGRGQLERDRHVAVVDVLASVSCMCLYSEIVDCWRLEDWTGVGWVTEASGESIALWPVLL